MDCSVETRSKSKKKTARFPRYHAEKHKNTFWFDRIFMPTRTAMSNQIAYWAKNDVTILPGPHIEWLTLN